MKRLLKIISAIIGVTIVIYGINVFLFYLNQEKLLFQAPEVEVEKLHNLHDQNDQVEEIVIEAEEGINLHGWLKHAENGAESSPVLIYFGGNGEDMSMALSQFEVLEEWSVLLVNYRGYGLSEGEPSERALFHDAELLYDEMKKRDDTSREIAVMGRSMGTAPATHLSAERDVSGTILVSPYDTRTRLTEYRHPYMPVRQVIRHPFENSKRAPEITSPLLGITGTDDTVIPPEHSEVTISSWGGPAEHLSFEGYGHNNLQLSPQYWEGIQMFLSDLSED